MLLTKENTTKVVFSPDLGNLANFYVSNFPKGIGPHRVLLNGDSRQLFFGGVEGQRDIEPPLRISFFVYDPKKEETVKRGNWSMKQFRDDTEIEVLVVK